MKENYHTHTVRCRHAEGTEREYIETAIKRGVKVLGFSDHSPQIFPGDYYSNFRMTPDEVDEYIRTIASLREEYHRDIDIKIGFEAEYYPEIFEKMLRFIAPYDIDYLILGQHFIDNEYEEYYHSSLPTEDEEKFKKYIDQCLEGLGTGVFTYIAHPDLFNFRGEDEIYRAEYKRLCEGAKSLGIPLEINHHGMAIRRHYPSKKFFSVAAEVGCDVIFGSDAHSPEEICNPEIVKKSEELAMELLLEPIEHLALRRIK